MAFLRVAIIESEPAFADIMRQNLEELGCNITGVYCTGEEAIKNVPDSDIDLIIVNVFLKGVKNGVDAAERIILSENIPVIFITRKTDKDDLSRINLFDHHRILQEPFTKDDLLNSIRQVYCQYVKSMNFYRDCKNLIFGVNHYMRNLIQRTDLPIKIFNITQEENSKSRQVTDLITKLENKIQIISNLDKGAIPNDEYIKRTVNSIIRYSDYLLKEIDKLDTEEVKNYLGFINVYLKVLLTSLESRTGTN